MNQTTRKTALKTIAKIAIIAAVAAVLTIFDVPLWFAPSFYKIDLSEVPVLVGAFALGPLAGACIEFIKVLLNLLLNGTVTGGIGELANFIIGCSFIVPASAVYLHRKSFKSAVLGMVIGTISLCIAGSVLNYFVLLPVYAGVFGMPIEALVGMGTAINPNIKDLSGFVLLAVLPFNLLKGVVSSLLTLLIYKRLSPILHK